MRGRCVFCDYEGPSPILEEFEHGYVIEPLNPVVPPTTVDGRGHVLVIPYRHAECFWSDPALTARVAEYASLYAARRGGHWNLITSAGSLATQTIDHLHIHLVPRRTEDGLMLPWSEKR